MRREIDGHERAEARLHVGHEEREPVEPALPSARCGDRGLGPGRLLRPPVRVTLFVPVVFDFVSIGSAGIGGTRGGGQGYLSGPAASLDGIVRSPPGAPTTTTGSPRLYSGASRTWLRVRSSVLVPGFLPGAKLSARQSTAILRTPMPRKPPKSMMAARICPSRLTMTSMIRPMSSPALLRTLLPRMAETSWSSSTTAGVPLGGFAGGLAAGGEGAAVGGDGVAAGGFSWPGCAGGGDGSACEIWLACAARTVPSARGRLELSLWTIPAAAALSVIAITAAIPEPIRIMCSPP